MTKKKKNGTDVKKSHGLSYGRIQPSAWRNAKNDAGRTVKTAQRILAIINLIVY